MGHAAVPPPAPAVPASPSPAGKAEAVVGMASSYDSRSRMRLSSSSLSARSLASSPAIAFILYCGACLPGPGCGAPLYCSEEARSPAATPEPPMARPGERGGARLGCSRARVAVDGSPV
ncbi:hypothetical protein GUJ93_ZPchr0006g42021 [Zizania palustris]|uniref:Uncharacterized protein n=1 Tax=Zizania palustris TaxID=103762 RepID=A0A8J5SK46_ZIZPA|nr:hypothetical protein GUJ93_ZPchr0006g42021 [Zizania palustris]